MFDRQILLMWREGTVDLFLESPSFLAAMLIIWPALYSSRIIFKPMSDAYYTTQFSGLIVFSGYMRIKQVMQGLAIED